MPNDQVMRQWSTALRGDLYTQGFGYLRAVNEEGALCHCPLGVLVDLAVQAGVVPAWTLTDVHAAGVRVYGIDKEFSALPQQVQEWAGLDSEVPSLFVPHSHDLDCYSPDDDEWPCTFDECVEFTVPELNDDHKYTYIQFADLIDDQLVTTEGRAA